MRAEDLERLERALDRLSGTDREIVVLARIIEAPHQEIAGALGITAAAVRVRLSRALARLASIMNRPEN